MKKYLITLLCASLAIPFIAGVPRLNRSDLGHVTMVENPVSETPKITGTDSMQSIQQFTRERHLTPNDNSLNNRSPRGQSIKDLLGAKIAEVDAYNFNWDDETSTAEISDSACAMMGKYCKLKSYSSQDGDVYLSGFYGDFEIPLNVNLTTGIVTLRTHVTLDVMSEFEYDMPIRGGVYWELYAVTYPWLTGNDDCGEYINGQVNEDGTITFNDDFAFLVKTLDGDSVSWGLSPIFKNLRLLTPNGTHGFDYTRFVENTDSGPHGHGYGGLVPPPKKPGSSKPVSPRPVSSKIGANNPSSNSNLSSETMTITHLLHIIKELLPVCLPDGHGGLVPPRKSGGSKPSTTGPFNDIVSGESGIDNNTEIKTGFNQHSNGFITTHELVPVYMKMVDDTTFIVYNLFGMGLRCHMIIDKINGTMYLPQQQIYNDGLGSKILVNRSCDGTMSQDGTITWEETGSLGTYPLFAHFESNILQFSGHSPFTVPLDPEFAEPVVTDTTVVFYATTEELDGIEVKLYMYDEETDEYLEVDNPLTVPRLTQLYWIYLAAIAYNPVTGVSSEIAWLEYEVPNLEINGILGDVNQDGQVNISDVSATINRLLSSNWDDMSSDNADCNLDGDVTISDVTILINYLLSGNWPD